MKFKNFRQYHFPLEDEIFSAYNGRFIFSVTKAYDLISSGKIKSRISTYSPEMMHFLSHPEFNAADETKFKNIEIDYDRPLGLIVNVEDPETRATEWMLIDGNHRTRKASESNRPGKFQVIDNPADVKKFMKFDKSVPHELFPEED